MNKLASHAAWELSSHVVKKFPTFYETWRHIKILSVNFTVGKMHPGLTQFVWEPFQCYSLIFAWIFQMASSLHPFWWKSCLHLLSLTFSEPSVFAKGLFSVYISMVNYYFLMRAVVGRHELLKCFRHFFSLLLMHVKDTYKMCQFIRCLGLNGWGELQFNTTHCWLCMAIILTVHCAS